MPSPKLIADIIAAGENVAPAVLRSAEADGLSLLGLMSEGGATAVARGTSGGAGNAAFHFLENVQTPGSMSSIPMLSGSSSVIREVRSTSATARVFNGNQDNVVQLLWQDAEKNHFGTGLVINGDSRLIVTANHVISGFLEEGGRVAVRRNGARSFDHAAIKISSDPNTDLAVLKLVGSRSGSEFWKLAGRQIESADADHIVTVGQPLMHLGIPNKSIVAATGKAEGVGPARTLWERLPDKAPAGELVKSSAIVERGMSGGPVFDAQNRLIGFNSFGLADSKDWAAELFPKTAVTTTRNLTSLLDKL